MQNLTAATAVEGQPVMIRKFYEGRLLQEYAGMFSRVTRNGYLRCREDDHGTFCDYPPREVFPV
jgi:hypothetical protein